MPVGGVTGRSGWLLLAPVLFIGFFPLPFLDDRVTADFKLAQAPRRTDPALLRAGSTAGLAWEAGDAVLLGPSP